MSTDKLRSALGDEAFIELVEMINKRPEPSSQRASWFRGIVKSWTMWFGALLIALPDLVPALAPQIQPLLDENAYKRMMNIAGIIVILLRFRTTQSVKQKGEAA